MRMALAQATFVAQIAPRRRSAPRFATRLPALGNGKVEFPRPGFASPDGLGRDEPDKVGHLVHGFDKADTIEMLDEIEDIALVVAERIEPALAIVDDDDDLGITTIFHRLAGALLQVERKPRPLQHGAAWHFRPQFFEIFFFHSTRQHLPVLLLSDSHSRSSRGRHRKPRRARRARAQRSTRQF